MAELGTIASIVGVVGFIGQVTQGCVYLKGLIGDIKAASQEMRRLQRELDIIVTICDELSTLYTNTNQQGADSTSALELCKEAVIEVSSEISPALLEFNKTKSTGVRLNRYLNQLKAAFSSPRMKQKIEKLSRAKDSLLAAQGNLSLTLINDQANRSLRLQECITRTELDVKQGLAETRKIQEGILALQVDASTSNGLQSEAVGAFRKLDDGIGHLQVQLAGTNLGVPRIEDGMADLRAQFSVSSTTMQQSLDAIPEIMRQIGEGLAQRQEEVLSQFLPDALRTALIRNHQSRGIETQRSVPVQARSDHVSKSSAIASIPRERPRNRRTARIKSTTLFCGISIITSEPLRPLRSIPNADDQEETDYDLPVYSSQTTIRIFAKLGVLNRVFEFTKFNHKYGNNIGATMKTRNIVSNDSEIFRAVKAADLVTMRQLFKNGQASPFDVNTRGDSLLDECVDLITKITCMDKINNQGSIPPDHESRFAAIPKFFEMTKLLLKYGVEFQSYSLACPVNYVLAGMDNSARKLQMLPSGFWSEICSLLLQYPSHDLFHEHWWRPGTYITLENIDHPFVKTLLQQETWVVDWGATLITHGSDSQPYMFFESDWQMLADPEGKKLVDAVEQGISQFYFNVTSGPDDGMQPLCMLLACFSPRTSDHDLATCIRNRLIILLRNGSETSYFPVTSWQLGAPYEEPHGFTSPGSEFAILTNTVDIWIEALTVVGWSEFEIMHHFDEALYFGIPDLVDGKTNYSPVGAEFPRYSEKLHTIPV